MSDPAGTASSEEGQPELVQPDVGESASATPASPGSAPQPVGVVKTARDLVAAGKYEDAIAQAKSALRRNEKYVPAMKVMARAYYELGKTEFAEAICDIA